MKKLIIKSYIENLTSVRESVAEWLNKLPLSNKHKANLEFCVIEAVINAIKHGNVKNPENLVVIEFEQSREGFVVSVSDSGQGFDPKTIGDPRDAMRLVSPTGRGIFFMRQMMNDVVFEFKSEGTTVRLFWKYQFSSGCNIISTQCRAAGC